MVCWSTTCTDAGVWNTVRPRRFELPATTLVLSGVAACWPELPVPCDDGLPVGFGAARIVRFGVPFELSPDGAVAVCGFGGETITGSSGVGACATAGLVNASSETTRPRGNAKPQNRSCREEVS